MNLGAVSPVRARLESVLSLFGLVAGAMMLGSSVYQWAVDVPNWTSALPDSAWDFRACLRYADPTRFYQVLNASAVIALLGSVIAAGWRPPRARNWWALGAILAFVATVVVTIVVVFPLNATLFYDPIGTHPEEAIDSAARLWQLAHYLRVMMLAVGVAAAARALRITTLAHDGGS